MTNRPLRPLIGIPASDAKVPAGAVPVFRALQSYTNALAAAGAAPVVIPLGLSEVELWELLERLDGLCLAGGPDVAPEEYAQERHPALKEVDAERDRTELVLTRRALEGEMPLLGICRGVQTLNVAAGGSLWQDIPSQIPGAVKHDYNSPPTPRDAITHAVSIVPGSCLAGAVGREGELGVNSFHHQAVQDVAPGYNVVAWGPDRVIEAIEAPGRRFVVGVQWHPEGTYGVDEPSRRLFHAFVEAARR